MIDQIEAIRGRNNKSWMDLVRLAWEVAPDRARALSYQITENDEAIMNLSKKMSRQTEGRAVLIPGGGILHTYAVREALALGLTPVVTDRDPNCMCRRISGVDFRAIDCYDIEAHMKEFDFSDSRWVGAFCGGADTHEVVAAAADEIGSIWVSRKTSTICRDKALMKKALLKAKVPTAKTTNKPPCIVKSLIGSGSRGIYRCASGPLSLLEGHFSEELLEGPEQSVEILLGTHARGINIVDRHFAWVDDQPLEWGHTNPSKLIPPAWIELYQLARKAAAAVGAKVGFFKIDSIWTKDGPKVLECTPRLSGGFDSQVSTPRSSGRNLLRYGLQLACGLEPDLALLTPKEDKESVTIIHRPELAGSPDQKG